MIFGMSSFETSQRGADVLPHYICPSGRVNCSQLASISGKLAR
jgi:hypothetical protein